MSDKVLIDTNLWVYLYAKSPEIKYFKVKQLVETNFNNIIFSAQIIGELYYVLTKKNFCAKEDAKDIIVEITTAFPVIEIYTANVLKALDIIIKPATLIGIAWCLRLHCLTIAGFFIQKICSIIKLLVTL
ncbi:PIN domain-containing protein [Candidatus Kuenenia sp.]|uniref:PIN domain-containing protein n=1 Tax=Candidatus Kuenenia sp. TaxID=2499824 RepID=UPI00322058E5